MNNYLERMQAKYKEGGMPAVLDYLMQQSLNAETAVFLAYMAREKGKLPAVTVRTLEDVITLGKEYQYVACLFAAQAAEEGLSMPSEIPPWYVGLRGDCIAVSHSFTVLYDVDIVVGSYPTRQRAMAQGELYLRDRRLLQGGAEGGDAGYTMTAEED